MKMLRKHFELGTQGSWLAVVLATVILVVPGQGQSPAPPARPGSLQ
jgi:hypothetical protein